MRIETVGQRKHSDRHTTNAYILNSYIQILVSHVLTLIKHPPIVGIHQHIATQSQFMLFSQGILLSTEPPPSLATLLAFMPAIPAMPTEAEDGGAEAGGEELDPKDGGTREVLLDPAPKDVLLEPADEPPKVVELDPAAEPPRVVEFEPADELALGLGEESESGKGGTAVPGEEALESGVAGAGDEELESGVAGTGDEEFESGMDAAGLDELDSGAGLASPASAPGRRLLMLLGSRLLSFSMSDDNIDWKIPGLLPDAVPALVPELPADGGE